MNSRRMSLSLCIGLAAVLTLVGMWIPAGPAFAHVTDVTINPDGTVAQPGGASVTVSGTLTCTHGSGGIFVTVGQGRGDHTTMAFAFSGYTCSVSQPQDWSVTVFSSAGFDPGPANVIVNVNNFGPDGFNFLTTADTVHLQPELWWRSDARAVGIVRKTAVGPLGGVSDPRAPSACVSWAPWEHAPGGLKPAIDANAFRTEVLGPVAG
jgi:hypothetical protein